MDLHHIQQMILFGLIIEFGALQNNNSTSADHVPTLYNSARWELVDGNDDEDPCAPISDWMQAFEGIQYFNSKVQAQDDDAGEIDPEDGTDNIQGLTMQTHFQNLVKEDYFL